MTTTTKKKKAAPPQEPIIVLVCGGRDFNDRVLMHEIMTSVRQKYNMWAVLHGDNPRGADAMAGEWARNVGMQEIRMPANWKFYRNSAGPIRNSAMDRLRPGLVVAFPGGAGTADMVKKAKASGTLVREVHGRTVARPVELEEES